MDKDSFKSFIDITIHELENMARVTPAKIENCTKGGTDFELVVKEALEHVQQQHKEYIFDIDYTKDSHRFPDIILDFHKDGKYGIEVKSSISKASPNSWKINGNSINGSTKEEDVIETYIIFGKTKLRKFKSGRYADCIADIATTHYPRYIVDMNLAPGEGFFAKSDIDYKTLTSSDDPVSLIAAYYRKQGKQTWWTGGSDEDNSNTVSAIVKFWTKDLTEEERKEYRGYAFIHFPEVLSSKYARFGAWLAYKGIINTSLRDCFTAKGKNPITIDGTNYPSCPRILTTLMECASSVRVALDNADIEELKDDWSQCIKTGQPDISTLNTNTKKSIWIKLAYDYLKPKSSLPSDALGYYLRLMILRLKE